MLSRRISTLRQKHLSCSLRNCFSTGGVSAWSPTGAVRENVTATGTSDSFYVVNLAAVVRQHDRWLKELPRVAPYYAVKCNNDNMVLQTLANLGCGFDCASPAEIAQVRALHVSPERLIYANPCKQPSHMQQAVQNDVNFTVFDSEEELFKIKEHMPDAQLLMRLRPDDSQSVCRFGMKYGADLDEVGSMLSTATELGLKVNGVSFHVGSGCYSAQSFADAVELASAAFDMSADYGFKFSVLDLGGGFPGEVHTGSTTGSASVAVDESTPSFQRPPPTFEAIAAALRPALDEHFPASRGVKLMAEPGRYYVHASHTLATQVIGRKVLNSEKNAGHRFKYYINDGIYGSFNCLLYDHAHVTPHVLPGGSDGRAAPEPEYCLSSLWGPTCDGLDCVMNEAQLPELQVGDWLYWEQMGAYTVAAASSFNGFSPPKPRYVYDGHPMSEGDHETSHYERQNVLPHVRLIGDELGTTSCRAADVA
jgi:ornithine decarboxylase